jgi:hypothetical protein
VLYDPKVTDDTVWGHGAADPVGLPPSSSGSGFCAALKSRLTWRLEPFNGKAILFAGISQGTTFTFVATVKHS